jgi:hypothetical protein
LLRSLAAIDEADVSTNPRWRSSPARASVARQASLPSTDDSCRRPCSESAFSG